MENEEAIRILRNPEEIFYSGDQLIQTEDAIEIAKIIEKLVEKIQMLERIQKDKEIEYCQHEDGEVDFDQDCNECKYYKGMNKDYEVLCNYGEDCEK